MFLLRWSNFHINPTIFDHFNVMWHNLLLLSTTKCCNKIVCVLCYVMPCHAACHIQRVCHATRLWLCCHGCKCIWIISHSSFHRHRHHHHHQSRSLNLSKHLHSTVTTTTIKCIATTCLYPLMLLRWRLRLLFVFIFKSYQPVSVSQDC